MALQCYNKGCQQSKFDECENNEEACQHHPGAPIFHEGYKGWSCCKKRSVDFTEFLSFPGCTRGPHNPVKPAEPEKPLKEESSVDDVIVVRAPLPKPEEQAPRPSSQEARVRLPATVSGSLKTALEKQMSEVTLDSTANGDVSSTPEVKIGESCKNNACKRTYTSEASNLEKCEYHPGAPVFHEGYKFWSCCQKRTSDFSEFLKQVGCTSSKHVWISDTPVKKECRFDWHQTAQFVTLTVYAKTCLPENTYVEVNRVSARVLVTYDKGNSVFEQELELHGVIDVEKSKLSLLGPKVEVMFRKAEPGSWPSLEVKQ